MKNCTNCPSKALSQLSKGCLSNTNDLQQLTEILKQATMKQNCLTATINAAVDYLLKQGFAISFQINCRYKYIISVLITLDRILI